MVIATSLSVMSWLGGSRPGERGRVDESVEQKWCELHRGQTKTQVRAKEDPAASTKKKSRRRIGLLIPRNIATTELTTSCGIK
jgi:hypothetical protein